MREIEFRGKHTHSNDFVFGYYVFNKERNEHKIDNGCGISWFIKPETVGQYTGLKDRNGTKIFEGDIVKFTDYDSYDYECFETAGVVMYGGNMFYVTNRHNVGMEDLVDDLENTMECEVIGNIFDDPELLEGAE